MTDITENTDIEQTTSTKKMKINMTPNEVVGYRISPDYYNWTVVIVKKHGSDSKNAGKEYETPMGYCTSLSNAVKYLLNKITAMETEKLQEQHANLTGEMAQIVAIDTAYKIAEEKVINMVKDLENRLVNAGYDINPTVVMKKLDEQEQKLN